MLKRRKVHIEKVETHPANIPYVLIGTGLLWFGWFGFNAGSALGANSLAVSAFSTTNTAAAAAGLSWMFFDVMRGKKPSVVGFCVGAVVGLVAITPAAGYVAVPQSIFIGVFAAVVSNMAVHFKATKTVLDDTLDVFTRFTGGREYSFIGEKSLEKAVSGISEELHSQYLLSYSPNNQGEGGFHDIRVIVNRPSLEVRTRPGYWVAARPE